MPINVNTNGSLGDLERRHGINQSQGRANQCVATANGRLSQRSCQKIFINCDNRPEKDVSQTTWFTRDTYEKANGNAFSSQWLKHKGDKLSMCSQDSYRSSQASRLRGGHNRTQQEVDKLILSPSQCKLKPLGMAYHKPKTEVNVIRLNLHGYESKNINTNFDCAYLPQSTKKSARTKTRTRGTQSLYRESSAQTLPYLPPVSNDPDDLEPMELFKLPTILPGDGPPGLYEVEVLERARKRWAFAKALKDNFRRQLQEARSQAKLPQHEHILEAFEWEHWIEREEYIQECQMLRLKILIRMFDKREQQMRTASQLRIQQSYQRIEQKRRAALRKNEIEFSRAMRRLEMQHSKRPRVWRKEHISHGLGDPGSEFYAPKMRHGVDPGRRHFTASRRGFDLRMDDLEKRTVKMDPRHLRCPFAKLKEWSKPKEVLQEVELNFCSEVNLRKLYESLRTLRETTEKQKTPPVCLIAKQSPSLIAEEAKLRPSAKVSIEDEIDTNGISHDDEYSTGDSDIQRLKDEQEHREYLQELHTEKQAERHQRDHLQQEMRNEEFETLIHAYEGNTIGWLMRFLSEEMCRLKEQRKLHFFTMLAKKERWHREAAEAGLRQKENCIRETYERLYQECEMAGRETAEKYVRSIMETDIDDYADQTAEEHIKAVAKDMDREIADWLQSLHGVQTPDNYYELRHAIQDIVFPDAEKVLYRLERSKCVDYIIHGVLLPKVYSSLESYDISFSLASDFVDRLIDNDMYLNSPECSSECECTGFCSCSRTRREAMAILRKIIRRSVAGKRWRSSTERIADENVKDILDDVFASVIPTGSIIETDKPMPKVERKFSYIDLTEPEREIYYSDISEEQSQQSQDYCKIKPMTDITYAPAQDITKDLFPSERLLLADPDRQSEDKLLVDSNEYTCPQPQPQPPIVHNIPSTHDISSVWDFNKTPTYYRTSSEDIMEDEAGEEELDEMTHFNMEEWSLEKSSTYMQLQMEEQQSEDEEENEETEEDHQSAKEEDFQTHRRTLESHIHFAETVVEETIIEPELQPEVNDNDDHDDEDEAPGVIPVSFSYDPTVKFTVPVRSTLEMHSDTEAPDNQTEDAEKEVKEEE